MSRFRGMPRDDLPLVRPAHIDLGESPIVLCLTTVHFARPPEPPSDDCGVAIPAHSEVGRLVSAELHSSATPNGDRLGFRQDRHLGDADDEVVPPQTVEFVGIPGAVSLIP